MAGIPLNTFKTVIKQVQRPNKIKPDGTYDTATYFDGIYPPGPGTTGNSSFLIYKAPLGVTSVILFAQVASIATVDRTVSVWHYRPNQSLYPVGFTTVINEFKVPPNDSSIVIGGKLVLETLDELYISSSDTDLVTPVPSNPEKSITDLKLIISVLETANQ